MTLDDMKARAKLWSGCGLEKDHQMLVALINMANKGQALIDERWDSDGEDRGRAFTAFEETLETLAAITP